MRNFLVVSCCLLIACANQKKMTSQHPTAFDSQGHRGCRGLMPENTVPAFLKALDLGVTSLEMDAAITADSQVLISHDPYFNHEISTAPDGHPVTAAEEKNLVIYRMSYAQTQGYDVGLRQHPRFPQQQNLRATKPLLATVIDSAEAHARTTGRAMPYYNIETKSTPATDGTHHPDPENFVRLLMQVIDSKGIRDRVIIQSFDFRTLQVLHRRYPGVHTAALIDGGNHKSLQEQIDILGFVPDIYSPFFGLVNKELVEACHQRKIRIIPWTVNELAAIEKLKAMGVDGIISDYPNLFLQLK